MSQCTDREGRAARQNLDEYTHARRIITFTLSMYSDDLCQGFRYKKRQQLTMAGPTNLRFTYYTFTKKSPWNLITILV